MKTLLGLVAIGGAAGALIVGCGHGIGIWGGGDGCTEHAAAYPVDSGDTLECHADATKVLVESDGYVLHVCRCPKVATPTK